MTKTERKVLRTALAWWRSHRPLGYTVHDHLNAPTVNANYTPAAERLAKAVAEWKHTK